MNDQERLNSRKEWLINHISKVCLRAGCFVCDEADKYESYTDCPYLPLKTIAKERPLTVDDIPDELVNK